MRKKQSIKKSKGDDLDGKRIKLMPIILLFLLPLLTFLAYLRSLNAPLIFDDSIYIEPSRLKGLFSHFSLGARSIAKMSFALNYQISGMNLVAFRVTNIILHIASAALAAYLTYVTLRLPSLRDKYGKVWSRLTPLHISVAVALLFSLHPIQTSAVNYITQRMAVMAAMFSFAGLIFYIKGATGKGRRSALYYVLSAFSFFLAIFSKENAVMVLVMLPVYDLVFISSFQWSQSRKRFFPLFILVTALVLIVAYNIPVPEFLEKLFALLSSPHQPMGNYGWTGVDIQWTPMEYVLTELRIVSRYIFLILFPDPSRLVFDYSNAYPVSRSLVDPFSTLLSLLFLASLLFFSLRYMKRFPLLSFGVLWYLVTISLESFVALGLDPYFEHRNYLPSLGAFLALASFLVYVDTPGIRTKKSGTPEIHRQSFRSGAIVSVIALLLLILTFARNGVWTKEYLLWEDALGKSPDNPRALTTLSSIYLRQGRFREAEECLQRASKIQSVTPRFRMAILVDQATLYKETNRRKEAMAILAGLRSEKALSDNERSDVHLMMGEILREEGKHSEAREYLERAYKIKHDNPVLIISLGLISRSLGEIDKAEGYFKSAIELAPEQPIPYVELGDIYFMKDDTDKAERYYREALAGGSDVPKSIARRVFLNLAQIKAAKGAVDESVALFKEVIAIDPAFYSPYIFLGDIYLKRGNPDAAVTYFEKALSLRETFVKDDPNTKLIYFNLGMTYGAKGDKRLAEKYFRSFLSMANNDKRLKDQIGKARERLGQMAE